MNAIASDDTAQISGLTHDGRGVAHGSESTSGKALFVSGALPGETVRLGPRRRHRRYDDAELQEVLTPSPDRVTPDCPHFGVCGGCRLQHLAAHAQLAAKETELAETLARIGHVQPDEWWPALEGPVYGYRRRARLGVRFVRKKGRLLVGFRETNGRLTTDSNRCPAMVEAGIKLPTLLRELIDGLVARNAISQVEFAAGDSDAALVFRVLELLNQRDAERLIAFGREYGYAIWVQTAGRDSLQLLHGSPRLAYALPQFDVTLHCLPTDFVQINAEVNQKLVAQAIERLELNGSERVLELFSGIGNFTLPLARKTREVVAVEGNDALVRRAQANARANGITNVKHYQADLMEPGAEADWQTGAYDAVLLDPPRSGAKELLPLLRRLAASRIVYVSCHPATLARDAAALVDAGWRLSGVGVADMFPQTSHVESMALFRRA